MSHPAPNAEVIEQIANLLDALGPFPPGAPREDKWRQTNQLVDELLENFGREVSLDQLDAILRQYESRYRERMKNGLPPEARIRRATYPDRTTVLPLWGSTRYHGQPWLEQPGQERTDSPEDIPPALRVPSGAPAVFFSHTHRDRRLARDVAEALARIGIGAWMFETHIESHGDIPVSVRSALESCACCVALVTRDSMASLWVLTELHAALACVGCLRLVFDTTDKQLCQLFGSLCYQCPDAEFDLSVTCDQSILGHLEESYGVYQRASRAERYQTQVHDFLATLPLYLKHFTEPALAFPDVPDDWSGPIRLAPLSDLTRTLEMNANTSR